MIFSIFGTINPPGSTNSYTKYGALAATTGLTRLLSNLLTFLITIAGLFTLVNFIIAGYLYLSANAEPQKIAAAGNKMLQSLIGLAIISVAFIIAGIIGYIFFKDPAFLFKPKFTKLF